MKMPALLAVTVLITAAVAQEKTPKEQPEASAEKFKELQKERVATLKQAADISHKMAIQLRIGMQEALEDRMAALKAGLDVTEKESERAALRKQTLESLKELEAVARQHFERGTGTELNVLRVKARRLEVEMQSEQAKANLSK